MSDVVISGTGLFTPPYVVTNEELVQAYNAYADMYNKTNSEAINSGEEEALQHSTCEFIEKASGIKQRYVMIKDGILDKERMMPLVPRRPDDVLSITAEMAIAAGREALSQANRKPEDIDLVIYGASTSQRPWPAVAVEVQQALGCGGYAFDMTVACSTGTFGISTAVDAILSGAATCALIVNPEYASPQINFRDRDSHFIFGDVATACIVEKQQTASGENLFRIIDRKLKTHFSNNIRTNASYLTRAEPNITFERFFEQDQFFIQQGRKVFKELLPMICSLVKNQLMSCELNISEIRRMWLHQANINMNMFVARGLLGRAPEPHEAPVVLDEYANTASAGSIIAFHKYKGDFNPGDKGILCSFGAGYSIGSLIMEKL
ncbi:MAG: beta-ketoacyl-ACP synthase III [Desulfobulbaceae bacterium S3730MH12]|nr:MAG: beta-ketoacyl-ACP synthase III [Desulfobulbaceae bacterium S5133MH15]OEU57469.1 MAG: beta-ketoacyl-ACP synthase III [Desulfobulbaceae bacterium S3730MH12]